MNIGVRQLAHWQELSKQQGEKIAVLTDAQIRLTDAQRHLAEAQARSEASLQAFIESVRKGNGRRIGR